MYYVNGIYIDVWWYDVQYMLWVHGFVFKAMVYNMSAMVYSMSICTHWYGILRLYGGKVYNVHWSSVYVLGEYNALKWSVQCTVYIL